MIFLAVLISFESSYQCVNVKLIFNDKIVFWLQIENAIVKPNENGTIKIIINFLPENHDQAPLISSTTAHRCILNTVYSFILSPLHLQRVSPRLNQICT